MEVDYPRVTHPFAGLLTLAGFLARLACVRHAASVRSEPGSNSPIKRFRPLPDPLARNVAWLLRMCFANSRNAGPHSVVGLLFSFQRPSATLGFENILEAEPCPPREARRPPFCVKGEVELLPSPGTVEKVRRGQRLRRLPDRGDSASS